VDVVRGGHHGVKLPQEAFDRIVTWIDLNTSYYGTYACNFPSNPYGRCPLTFERIERLAALTGAGVAVKARGAVDGPEAATGVNFTRPELSACLSGFAEKGGPNYVEALALIREGRRVLYETTRADMPDFVLRNPADLAREQRATCVKAKTERVKSAIIAGRRVTDE
jgi:hypothetical protein